MGLLFASLFVFSCKCRPFKIKRGKGSKIFYLVWLEAHILSHMPIKQRKELNVLTRLHWSGAKLLLISGGTHTQNVDFFVDFLQLVDLLCTFL